MTTGDPHPAPDAREQRSVLVATGISAFLGSATFAVTFLLSMALVALILGHHMGQRALGPDAVPELLASTRVAFALFSALCVVGLLASLARGRVR